MGPVTLVLVTQPKIDLKCMNIRKTFYITEFKLPKTRIQCLQWYCPERARASRLSFGMNNNIDWKISFAPVTTALKTMMIPTVTDFDARYKYLGYERQLIIANNLLYGGMERML